MRKFIFALSIGLCLWFGLQAANAQGIVGDLAKCKLYSVNITAYENCPKSESAQRIAVLADFNVNPNGTSFATLDKRNKIFLVPGDFRVLASNACSTTSFNPCTGSNGGACLQLPNGGYLVAVRLVGKPGTEIESYLCANSGGTVVCSTDHYTRTRFTGKGEPSFTNATHALLDINGVPIFDGAFTNYFWNWGTDGKAHAQVWFIDAACEDLPDGF